MNGATARRWAAEAGGTAVLVATGTGTIVAAARTGGIPQWEMAIAWFTAVLAPIVVCARVSGAHLNPAVTLALAVDRRLEWRSVPGYWVAQFLGALGGSGLVLASLGDWSHLGATVPSRGPLAWGWVGEAVFTSLLVVSVFVLADHGEGRFRWRLVLPATAVGVSTYVIGPWTGSSLNPARTLAPALLSGTYADLAWYLTVVPAAAVVTALLWAVRRDGFGR